MEKSTIKFKCANLNITPTKMLYLSGYGQNRISSSVADRLEINIILIKNKGTNLCFVSADLLFLSEKFCQIAWDNLKIPKRNIFLGATHTHSAPNIDPSKENLGRVDQQYCDSVLDSFKKGIALLQNQKFQEGTLEFTSTHLLGSVSRRKKAIIFRKNILPHYGLQMYPNPSAEIDNIANILIIKDLKKRLKGVLWQFPCHPVAFPDESAISSDYPGHVRSALRKKHGNISVLFYQGFSGDIRPFCSDKSTSLKNRVLSYLNGGIFPFSRFSLSKYASWSKNISDGIIQCISESSHALQPRFQSSIATFPLSEILDDHDSAKSFSVKALVISKNIAVLGMTAEVCNDVGKLMPKFEGNLIKIGCLDCCFGYLPTSQMVEEKGYEVEGFFSGFHLTGKFRKGLDKFISNSVKLVFKDIEFL